MIKSKEHAMAVQQRRVNSGKKGVAKAVRRYNKNQSSTQGFDLNWEFPSNFEGCRSFEETY